MNRITTIVLATAALGLGACATAPTASFADPHAVVASRVGAAATFPVTVVEVDGVSIAARQDYALSPGRHTLRVVAVIDENTALPGMPDPRRTGYPARDIVLDVEAGKRYTLAARWNGPSGLDWTPIVLRVEDVG